MSDPRSLAAIEVKLSLAAVKYAFHARGGRLQPSSLSLWLDYAPKPPHAVEVLKGLLAAESVAAGLKAMHPQHAQFEALRQAYLKERGGGVRPTTARTTA